MRGAPQRGLASAILRINCRRCRSSAGRPPMVRARLAQYQLKPRRCQPMTVAGRTTTRADAQSGQRRRRPTQNSRSGQRAAAWVGGADTWPTAAGGRGSRARGHDVRQRRERPAEVLARAGRPWPKIACQPVPEVSSWLEVPSFGEQQLRDPLRWSGPRYVGRDPEADGQRRWGRGLVMMEMIGRSLTHLNSSRAVGVSVGGVDNSRKKVPSVRADSSAIPREQRLLRRTQKSASCARSV